MAQMKPSAASGQSYRNHSALTGKGKGETVTSLKISGDDDGLTEKAVGAW